MGIHFHGNKPIVIDGDIVGGDKTTIISAAIRQPNSLLEKAEEMILDAESLAFGEARDLLKTLNRIKKAEKSGDKDGFKKALSDIEAQPGSTVIAVIIKEIRENTATERDKTNPMD